MQIVARANALGLGISATQLFAHPTIADLAAVAGTTPPIQADQDLVTGPVPLSPRQRWLFRGRTDREVRRRQASLVLASREPLDSPRLERAIHAVIAHHDALRLRFTLDGTTWHQTLVDREEGQVVEEIALGHLIPNDQDAFMAAVARRTRDAMDLAHGPVIRLFLFNLGDERPNELLVVAHHAVADGYSLSIVASDLEAAYRQLERGESVSLPARTTSFARWALMLDEYARSPQIEAEIPYWLALAEKVGPAAPGTGSEIGLEVRRVIELDESTSQALLGRVPGRFNAGLSDVLLGAFLWALAGVDQSALFLADVRTHGRNAIFPGADVTRTVGWFTASVPVLADIRPEWGPDGAIDQVREQLRDVPNGGIGYDLLTQHDRYSSLAGRLQPLDEPAVSFNFQSQVTNLFDSPLFTLRRMGEETNDITDSVRKSKVYHRIHLKPRVRTGTIQIVLLYHELGRFASHIDTIVERYNDAIAFLCREARDAEPSLSS
jgi:non-ribosomal peptide synthase protein (TIGR01720 family)